MSSGRPDCGSTTSCESTASPADDARCVVERAHALLRPPHMSHNQALRFPGRPWLLTTAYRESVPRAALAGLQTGHVRLFELVTDTLIGCSSGRCVPSACTRWNRDAALDLQTQLEEQLDDALLGSQPAQSTPEFDLIYHAVWAMSTAWLQQ